MARGSKPGERRGGRTKGTPNKRTADRAKAVEIAAQQITQALGPDVFEGDAHALLMSVYKDTTQPIDLRLDAAKAAVGYEKPRLQSSENKLSGSLGYEPVRIPLSEREDYPMDASARPANGRDPKALGH